MPVLLLQSCSGAKQETDEPIGALDLYDGYFYRIIKKSMREGEFRDDLDMVILSAEHGLIDPDTRIRTYDRRIDEARAKELRADTVRELRQRVTEGGYDAVVVNMGADYRSAISGLEEEVDVPVKRLAGDGIGEKGHELHQFIRSNPTVLGSLA